MNYDDNTMAQPFPSDPPSSITVRFVEDTKEKLTNGDWVMIPETKMACEGNSRSYLASVIERRRQQRLMIFRRIGNEEIIPIV
jgi:hypothetical protein